MAIQQDARIVTEKKRESVLFASRHLLAHQTRSFVLTHVKQSIGHKLSRFVSDAKNNSVRLGILRESTVLKDVGMTMFLEGLTILLFLLSKL